MASNSNKKIEMLVRALADAHQRASALEEQDTAFSPIEALIFEAYQQAVDLENKARNERAAARAARYGIEVAK